LDAPLAFLARFVAVYLSNPNAVVARFSADG
jgi:hypothetical protein